MRNTSIIGLVLATMFSGGLHQAAGTMDTPSSEDVENLPTGINTDRLNAKQRRIWRTMEQVLSARDGAGRPLRPVLNELYNWARTCSVPIYLEMPKAPGRWSYAAAESLFAKQPALNRRLAPVTIRLYVRVIDNAAGLRIAGERGFVPFEGLTGEKRYCETLAHELVHARQAVTDPEYLQLIERQKSLNRQFLRLRLVAGSKQSATKEMLAIADEIDLLWERIEGPATAVEQQVWRELTTDRRRPEDLQKGEPTYHGDPSSTKQESLRSGRRNRASDRKVSHSSKNKEAGRFS